MYRNHTEALNALILDPGLNAEEVVKTLHDETGQFHIDEGPLHDYKREYPFSSTDSVFGSILRLICAMHNSYGGVIVFGVHNELKTAGKNKVIIDSEKVNRKLRELLSNELQIDTKSVETPSGAAQLLIVRRRAPMDPPIYSVKSLPDCPEGAIFLRTGAEVLRATGADLTFLYGSRDHVFSDSESLDFSIAASMPPSPATIQEFVGRFKAIEKLFTWVKKSRDPRMFLWGQGGSGKSTIAYEFASIIAHSGRLLSNKANKRIERVLYISGKAVYLNPHTGRMEPTLSKDFENAQDLFRAILILSGWESAEKVLAYDDGALISALEELFELETQIIVLDDIDTLTTSNKDGGMEELFLLLSRAKSGTKVIYTQRGFPSFAPNAAIEVPSLNTEELDQFIQLCSDKFKVELPNSLDRSLIADLSESRPLAIETLMAMRRVTSSYPETFRRWKEQSGEARQYLFSREYEQLNKNDRGRHLLAALSVLQGPQTFQTLRDVLQFSPEQLEDSIAEVRDMFLRVTPNQSGAGDLYSIGSATSFFVSEMSTQLDRFSSIQARVQHFKTPNIGTPSAFVPLITRALRMIDAKNPGEAVAFLTKRDLPDAFKEHPEVKAVLAKAYSKTAPPKVLEARACFEAAYTLGHRHYEMYLSWLNMERDNRTEIANGISICESILKAEGFDGKTRANFRKRLARYQSLKANEVELASPAESKFLRNQSVANNVLAFCEAQDASDPSLMSYKEAAENSISIGLRRHLSASDFDAFLELFDAITSLEVSIDELAPLLVSRFGEVLTKMRSNSRPITARMNKLANKVSNPSLKGLEAKNKALISGVIKGTVQSVSQLPSER